MSIKDEIERISDNVSDALAATAEMGASVPATASSDDLGTLIRSIPKSDGAPTFDYAAYGLPVLALTGDVSAMTKDNAVDLAYQYGERSGTASVKWQGSSSLAYPKKNYTIKFDNAFEAVEGWGEQKKYCLKANYIDHSHARNVVSAKLWGQIVKSRTTVPVKLADLPNGGAVDGFPVIITLNGEFHGLYTFNIPKDAWLFGMGNTETEYLTEVLVADGCTNAGIDPATFTYVSANAATTGNAIRKRSSVSGGRLYIDFDPEKCKEFSCRIYIFDNTGAPYKWIAGRNSNWEACITPNRDRVDDPVIGGFDYDSVNWLNAGEEGLRSLIIEAPFSIPIPDGCTALVLLSNWSSAVYPDGTITPTWSQEASNNNTWADKWQAEGVVVTQVSALTAKEALVSANNHSSATGFFGEALLDESDFEIEYAPDEDNTEWVKASLNTLINACINSDGTDLDTTIAQYLDWQSAIDNYIFVMLLRGGDMLDKNYLLATYDGTKWFFSVYDMDSTYGLSWTGKSIGSSTGYSLTQCAGAHKVMDLIRKYKTAELKERYAEIREAIMSEDNVALSFLNFIAPISKIVFDEDLKKWPSIPSSAASDVNQILNWFRMRVQVIDKEIEAL